MSCCNRNLRRALEEVNLRSGGDRPPQLGDLPAQRESGLLAYLFFCNAKRLRNLEGFAPAGPDQELRTSHSGTGLKLGRSAA